MRPEFRLRTKILAVLLLFLVVAIWLDRIFDLPDISSAISYILRGRERVAVIKYFPFSIPDSLKEWEEKVLSKRVDYKISSFGGGSCVRAISDGSCSALYHKVRIDINLHPFLSWKWRIIKFPEKKFPDDLLSEEEDDFAARMYVIFPALFFSKTRVLEYIWSKDLKVGAVSQSPYSDNIKLIVAESGLNEGDMWIFEERDIYEDYLLAFNRKPKVKIGAIAFMCDSDSTGSSAEALFDEIKLFIKD